MVKGVEGNDSMRRKFEQMLREAQNKICSAVEELDGEGTFRQDVWERENGGGGISRVMAGGKVWEKAGCSLSVVYGSMPQEALASATERGVDRAKGMEPGERVPFFACGLSSVMHPRNPMAPTMHFNYRYFETDGGVWWFGGGTDITPAYLFEEDMAHFHGAISASATRGHRTMTWVVSFSSLSRFGPRRGRRGVSERPQSRRWRLHETAPPRRRPRDPTGVYVVIRTPSARRPIAAETARRATVSTIAGPELLRRLEAVQRQRRALHEALPGHAHLLHRV